MHSRELVDVLTDDDAEVLEAHPVDALVNRRDELDVRDRSPVEDLERLGEHDQGRQDRLPRWSDSARLAQPGVLTVITELSLPLNRCLVLRRSELDAVPGLVETQERASVEQRALAVPDVYATITQAELPVVEGLVEILEFRAKDPQQQAMRELYFSDIEFPVNARVVEVGCGPGPVARALASRSGVREVVGVDPSPIFIEKGRELAWDLPNLTFVEGDARALPFEDNSFDVVVFHTTLCHIPGPELALAEASRVLSSGGLLAVFDGDYATTTCACGDFDPLEACAEACVEYLVHDRWLVRRLPRLVRAAGFDLGRFRSHSYMEAPFSGGYMLAIVDRGADALLASGRITPETADALKAEARRRSEAGEFYGHIAYASLIAQKP
jgi:ubiquinone/menaquinone biosynthesis C-methylase UbiE